jgi:hypothetical protein
MRKEGKWGIGKKEKVNKKKLSVVIPIFPISLFPSLRELSKEW